MERSNIGVPLVWVAIGVLWQCTVAVADLPTGEQVLQIHRANKERLSRLHLQVVHREETTAARCRTRQQEADKKEKFVEAASKFEADGASAEIEIDSKKFKGEEAVLLIRQMAAVEKRDIEWMRAESKPWCRREPMEFFFNGNDYQFRKPKKSFETDQELAEWQFPEAPLSSESLLGTYRDVSIYSRSAQLTPAGRCWHHGGGTDAMITQKPLQRVMSVQGPPFTDVTQPQWGAWHAFDAFFSRSAEEYRVVREEELDGVRLAVVDVTVPIGEMGELLLAYRGWLDMKRGALPLKMYHRQNSKNAPVKAPEDQFDRFQPSQIFITHEIRELPNGAFYPTKTVREDWDRDPDAAEPTQAEWLEIQVGKRKLALVVHRRNTWTASVVEVPERFDDQFFVLPFSEGMKIFDHDKGQVVGALKKKRLVRVGKQAPPLTIAYWVDGKTRTLDDLRGQVIVLNFNGPWRGPRRNSVSRLNGIPARFTEQPVTFICVHTADRDVPSLAAKIKEFQDKLDRHELMAIDTGRMVEDSVTTTDYGIHDFPKLVIIGRDGKVAYVDPDTDGPSCDEDDPIILAKFQKKFDKYWKARFKLAGEPWPIPEGLDDQRQLEIYQRVDAAFLAERIEAALKAPVANSP